MSTTVRRSLVTAALAALLALMLGCQRAADPAAPAFGVATGWQSLTMSDADLTRYMNEMDALGVKYLRTDFTMGYIFANGLNAPRWDRTDRLVNYAEARGMVMLPAVMESPSWAADPAYQTTHAPWHRPWADMGLLEDAVRQVIARYYGRGLRVFEFWNEPNIDGFFGVQGRPVDDRDVRKYAQMLAAANRAADSVAPDDEITLLGGALAGIGYYPGGPHHHGNPSMGALHYLEKLYDPAIGNARGTFDHLSFHPYFCAVGPQQNDVSDAFRFDAGPSEESCGWHKLEATTPSVRSIMTAVGDGALKVWATELGASTHTNGPTEASQAQYITRGVAEWTAKPYAGGFVLYTGKDPGTAAASAEDNYGLINEDWRRKPAFAAYRDAIASAAPPATRGKRWSLPGVLLHPP